MRKLNSTAFCFVLFLRKFNLLETVCKWKPRINADFCCVRYCVCFWRMEVIRHIWIRLCQDTLYMSSGEWTHHWFYFFSYLPHQTWQVGDCSHVLFRWILRYGRVLKAHTSTIDKTSKVNWRLCTIWNWYTRNLVINLGCVRYLSNTTWQQLPSAGFYYTIRIKRLTVR